jgi:Cd2+/Zn2+-exporting ATPase
MDHSAISSCGCCSKESDDRSTAYPQSSSSSHEQTVIYIPEMTRQEHINKVRQQLKGMPGILSMRFEAARQRLVLQHQLPALCPVYTALAEIGLSSQMLETEKITPASSWQARFGKRQRWIALGVAGCAALAAELLSFTVDEHHPLVAALAIFAVAVGGFTTYRKGWMALKKLDMNMNALMSIAATGAMLIQHWPEAAMVMVLFSLSEEIESWSLAHARRSIRNLMSKAPEMAHVKTEDGTFKDVKADAVPLKAVVWIKPGERIPLDGVVLTGRSAVNQAAITGESIPVEKGPEDQVFAGTINESGTFEYEVTSLAADSQLARIITMVEEAQGQRAPLQRFVDRFARVYTPVVLATALLVALVPPLAFAMPFAEWCYRALVLLVIACPCALVISTPVTIVSGLAAAARHGFLVKGGAVLELGRKLKSIAFDKTGTLTCGKPRVTDVSPLADKDEVECQELAAHLADSSHHPLSLAITNHLTTVKSTSPRYRVEEFEALGGRGIKARIKDSWHFLGNRRLIKELGLGSDQLEAVVAQFEKQGKSIVVLANEQQALCVFAFEDTVKETSRAAISDLLALKVHPVILSGDSTSIVHSIARIVGVKDARGQLLPAEKLAGVEELLHTYGTVGMAGDGINDAPALAKASVGFAMGAAGSDVAIETADVALLDDDLRKIPRFIRLSRAAHDILVQNFSFAIGIKALFLGLAMSGSATLWMAVFADVGASLIVIFNGLRLLRFFDRGSEPAH